MASGFNAFDELEKFESTLREKKEYDRVYTESKKQTDKAHSEAARRKAEEQLLRKIDRIRNGDATLITAYIGQSLSQCNDLIYDLLGSNSNYFVDEFGYYVYRSRSYEGVIIRGSDRPRNRVEVVLPCRVVCVPWLRPDNRPKVNSESR